MRSLRPWVVLSLAVLTATPAHAEDRRVTSTPELLQALSDVGAGDAIVLADGAYSSGDLRCDVPGTAAVPIVVRAEHPREATLQFTQSEGFRVSAPHWHFEGLAIEGACNDDDTCEHAFHVTGAAHGFVLRDSVVTDFNAQLKVNAAQVDGRFVAPDDGLVERCDIGDTRARATSRPVTKLNIDGGRGWVVRDNYLHDFQKVQGNGVSYGAFMKSGGAEGLFERNLVICDGGLHGGGARIGLSFGGGGTGAQFCAPAYDEAVPCDPEHTGGTMRNNLIASCSDVGIYLNQARDTALLHNTLVATAGIDFRFGSSSGVAEGNLLEGTIRDREGGRHSEMDTRTGVARSSFDAWYTDPAAGDFSLQAPPADLLSATGSLVDDDYCGRVRPQGTRTLGALEHSLGNCDTRPWRGWEPDTETDPDAGLTGDGGARDGGVLDAGALEEVDAGVSAGVDAGGFGTQGDGGAVADTDGGASGALPDGSPGASGPPASGGGCAAHGPRLGDALGFRGWLLLEFVFWLALWRISRRTPG